MKITEGTIKDISCLVAMLCMVITLLLIPWKKINPTLGIMIATAVFYTVMIGTKPFFNKFYKDKEGY